MTRYRKKPVVIEAMQLCRKNLRLLPLFLGEQFSSDNPVRETNRYRDPCGEVGPFIELAIHTREGVMLAQHGDWIIRGVAGEFYPCDPVDFAQTYEAAHD